ncbi:MAG: ABC transporter substrate-binding protein [Acidimicrobiia bacterium]|nr:ABC transporter substrate-binding protein [Acidimicrobiia bacterium]NNC74348.1 carbohydrate ABC transporter substrate-binding protein [Acidimicrobiia bacterium]
MRKHVWIVLVLAFALIAAACGGDDLEGTSVTVFGPESSEEEAGALQDALDILAERTGIDIVYTGARDFSDQINAQAIGGNPPDIAVFPQPGKVADFARQGLVIALPEDVADAATDNWPAAWNAFGIVDGTQYAIPTKTDLKSLVWYVPGSFEAKGYEVPETWDALKALSNEMIANGDTPWCVGIESGPATGWTFTDWVEDLMLRFHGADVYDQWVDHTIPFTDSRVEQAWNEVLDLWNTDGAVFAAGGTIAATPFGDNGQPLVDGKCLMHRQASFYSAFLPENTVTGPDGVDVFYFPAVDPANAPVLGAGTLVASFRDAPEVWEVMEYFSTAEYAEERQKAQAARKGGGDVLSGFLSAANGLDTSVYTPLEQSLVSILSGADVVRFDASDLMPAAVGGGSFWTEATSAVNGDKSVADALAAIDASWP